MHLPAVRIASLATQGPSPLTHHFFQGVMVYLVTVTCAVVVQSLAFRIPSVRKALDIPRIPHQTPTKPPTFMETVKFGMDWYKSKSAEAQAQARAQQRKKF